MKLGRIQKRYVAVIILATALISSFVTYSFAGSISNTLTLSAGVYPGAPSYTIWTDGTTYYAKDQNGVIDYSGTGFSTVFNSCVDADAHVHLSPGTYTVAVGTYLRVSDSNFELSGSGIGNTIIQVATGHTCDQIIVFKGLSTASIENVTIRDLTVKGNAGAYVASYSNINLEYVENFLVSHIQSSLTRDCALRLKEVNIGTVENCFLDANTEPDAAVGYKHCCYMVGNNTNFMGNYFRNAKDGLAFFNSVNETVWNTVTGNTFDDCHHGVIGNYGQHTTISGNTFKIAHNNGSRGVSWGGGSAGNQWSGIVTITGNDFWYNSPLYPDNLDWDDELYSEYAESGIRLEYGNGAVIAGNVFNLGNNETGCGYGILLVNYDDVSITGNTFLGFKEQAIRIRTYSYAISVTGNSIWPQTGASAIQGTYGIWANETCRDISIVGNLIQYCETGVYLGSTVSYAFVHTNTFRTCTTEVDDNGASSDIDDNYA